MLCEHFNVPFNGVQVIATYSSQITFNKLRREKSYVDMQWFWFCFLRRSRVVDYSASIHLEGFTPNNIKQLNQTKVLTPCLQRCNRDCAGGHDPFTSEANSHVGRRTTNPRQ